MKVIVAGAPKTGTKSMHEALTLLGYKAIYDFPENIELRRQWGKIFEQGGTVEDFRKMFDGVDAVMDVPCCHYWEEILKAYPEAKIVLTLRDNEEDWWRSYYNQQQSLKPWIVFLMMILSPTYRSFLEYLRGFTSSILGFEFRSQFRLTSPFTVHSNEMAVRMWYRRHNA